MIYAIILTKTTVQGDTLRVSLHRVLVPAAGPQRMKNSQVAAANQRSEQQGMVLVHMGTRPARASLICMARA